MTDQNPPRKKQKVKTQEGSKGVILEKDGDRFRCMFTLVNKGGRQCNMTRKESDKYCAQHKLVCLNLISSN